MLLGNFLQKAFYRLFALILATFVTASSPIVAPSTEESIKPLRPNEVQVTFATLADPQIGNYQFKRYPVFEEAMIDLHASEGSLDAVLIAGDVTENGLADEYQLVYDKLSGIDTRYLIAVGNHDIRLRLYSQSQKRFTAFVNALNGDDKMTELSYSEEINGYKFIVMGSERTEFEESYFSEEYLTWLDNEIASANGKPVFVMCHQPLKLTHGLPDTWGSPIDSAGSIGAQNDRLREILTSYNNVIFITGHLHTGMGQYTYETDGKLSMVNLPSLTINNKDGEYNGPGIGYIVEVYGSEIIFRARNFAQGKWVSDYDITIPVVR